MRRPTAVEMLSNRSTPSVLRYNEKVDPQTEQGLVLSSEKHGKPILTNLAMRTEGIFRLRPEDGKDLLAIHRSCFPALVAVVVLLPEACCSYRRVSRLVPKSCPTIAWIRKAYQLRQRGSPLGGGTKARRRPCLGGSAR